MGHAGHQDRRERIGIDVGVVTDDPRGGDDERRVLDRVVGVVDGDGEVVDVGKDDRDRGHVRVDLPVAGHVGEGVRPAEAGARNVSERAVGLEGDDTVSRRCDEPGGDRIAVDVKVVGKYPRSRDREQGSVEPGEGVVDGDRGVVYRRDRDPKRLRRARIGAEESRAAIVLGLYRHQGRTMGIRGRGEGERAVRGDRRGDGEEGRRVGRDEKDNGLGRLVGRAGADVRRPSYDRLGSGILEDGLIGTGSERRGDIGDGVSET